MGNSTDKCHKEGAQNNICNKVAAREELRSEKEESDSFPIDEVPDLETLEQPKRRTAVFAECIDISSERQDEPYECYPKTEKQKSDLRKVLKDIVIFSQLSEDDEAAVIDAMFERKTKAGEQIIAEGESGDNFYVIVSGNFDIYIKGEKIGCYKGSGSFGELALLYNTQRAATVVSHGKGTLWAMSRNSFRKIVLTQAFKRRQRYENLLSSVEIFKCLSPFERMNVCDALTSRVYDDGDIIITEGQPGTEMYFIEEGEVRIVKNLNNKEIEVKRLKKNSYFGELALHTQRTRAASVYAVGHTTVAVLSIAGFERLLGPCLHVLKRDMNEYQKEVERLFSDPERLELRQGIDTI